MATLPIVKAMLAAFAKNWSDKEDHCRDAKVISFWEEYLADIPDDLLRAAAKTVLSEAVFFPKVADVRAMAFRLQKDAHNVPEAEEAWGQLIRWLRATAHILCDDGVIRKKPPLPDHIQKAVDAIGGLEVFGTSDNAVSDRARFIAAYERFMERAKHQATMLPEVKQLLQRAALPEGAKVMLPDSADVGAKE